MTREQAECLYGPIKTVCQFPPIPIRSLDWCAYFDNYLEVDCPSWVQATGETEAEALETLLEQAYEHAEEEAEAEDHVHTCQQCDKLLDAHCACGKPNINVWCSSRCREAFDL